MNYKFEIFGVVLPLHLLKDGLSLTLLTVFVSLSTSPVRNFELICVTVGHLCPPHSQSVFSLDFHFSSSAVHAEPHEQTDVERAEESKGCALSGRSTA